MSRHYVANQPNALAFVNHPIPVSQISRRWITHYIAGFFHRPLLDYGCLLRIVCFQLMDGDQCLVFYL
jgi:hypothetical protein